MATVKRAFRFEAWGGDLVIQRELETEADLAVVQEISPGPGRAHLQAYLDQEAGAILGLLAERQAIGDLKVGGPPSTVYPGLYLANCAATFGWNGCGSAAGPASCRARSRWQQSRIHRADGSIVYGQSDRLRPIVRCVCDQERQARAGSRRDKIMRSFPVGARR